MTNQKKQESLKKFDVLKRWMIEDTQNTMFNARANFLAAQGLLNFTEIIGAFLEPGSTNGGVRFDTFLKRMGPQYEKLLNRFNKHRKRNPHIIYDDLRCGLAHEFMIKRKPFTIYNSLLPLEDHQIRNLNIHFEGHSVPCDAGIISLKDQHGKLSWHFIVPTYWLDFRIALEQYWEDILNEQNIELRENFFKRASETNFANFHVL